MPKSNRKEFKIGVTYLNWGYLYVEAETLEKAITYAKENIEELPLPDNANYVNNSFEIDEDSTRKYLNN